MKLQLKDYLFLGIILICVLGWSFESCKDSPPCEPKTIYVESPPLVDTSFVPTTEVVYKVKEIEIPFEDTARIVELKNKYSMLQVSALNVLNQLQDQFELKDDSLQSLRNNISGLRSALDTLRVQLETQIVTEIIDAQEYVMAYELEYIGSIERFITDVRVKPGAGISSLPKRQQPKRYAIGLHGGVWGNPDGLRYLLGLSFADGPYRVSGSVLPPLNNDPTLFIMEFEYDFRFGQYK